MSTPAGQLLPTSRDAVNDGEPRGEPEAKESMRKGKYRMKPRAIMLVLFLLASCGSVQGGPVRHDDYHWTGVERVVAVADLHGDYGQYIKVLESAGLVNSRGRWSGGTVHLVQTGDVPDRGPDSRRIIDHLQQLKRQAERKGGMVHTLIGNHEAMNSYGDLRYVHPGEYEAFVGKNSAAYREKQWEFQLQRMQQNKPEEFLELDLQEFRRKWEEQIPLGWVEHRLAWAPDGEYGQWIAGNPVTVMVNGTLFVHGGISPAYCRMSVAEINARAREELMAYDPATPGVIDAEDGPLWYRGLADEDEAYFTPAVDQILERYGAARIVVGHTPTGGVVWPRFGARVLVNDTGIAAYYGGNDAYLELSGASARAGYGDQLFDLPPDDEGRIAYLREVIALRPGNEHLQKRLDRLLAPPDQAAPAEPVEDGHLSGEASGEGPGEDAEPLTAEPPRPPISAGICQ